AFVDFDFETLGPLNPVQHFQTAPATRAADWVVGIADLLKLLEHEARHDDQAFEKVGLNQVRDASVNNDAGVQQQEIVGLVLRGKADVGDDEREILLVAAHGQHDADVAEAQKEGKTNQPAGGLFRHIFKEAGVVDEERDDGAQQQAESGGRKSAQGKTLEHFVDGDQQAAKTKAGGGAQQGAVRDLDQLGAHLADRPTGDGAH